MFGPLNPRFAAWTGQTVWVIGGSSGIGAALVRRLLAAGARVALSARRADKLERLAAQNPAALVLPLDVTDPQAWATGWHTLLLHWGMPDLVVFCAADYRPERSWQIAAGPARRTLEINLAGVYYGLELIVPAMLASRHGGIALIASVAGYVGLPGATVYGPTKAALINLAELLYCDLHRHGLGVYLVNPGFVKTPLTDKNDFTMPALQTPEQAAARILSGIARGRFEIHFPRRFTLLMKLLRLLPQRPRLALLQRMVAHES
ncbi:SDR family NAD(P)-dependent oxidoreductase [Jeongeupia naejangsanensis]|uniref:SDR family NAD(P)-dependent oxidoreductase n=1 Tax=Jeongeupia naejangsanensis TaxID=613195 RepID=A0ABS2BNT3_9NEIS|nr:SDR family NAD(P)-dependent oxidoreductase [Jeongeupia naejangsanensis]MBM3117258.1 SDR family NAD(P)-dependent oxidoreductase [Jeongeupia naejangsanensis]